MPSDITERDQKRNDTKRPGMALCLSGGGYRALLFHVGALKRLNELGILSKLERISSVSGGSIIAGLLGLKWNQFQFNNGVITNFEEKIIDPIIKLTNHTIDISTAILGFTTLRGPGKQLIRTYKKHLFSNSTLQDLPDKPRIIICSTSLRSGVYCRFSKPYIWDYRIGQIKNPKVYIALAVAASSAFPPILSPVKFNTNSLIFESNSGFDLGNKKYQNKMLLTDGGIYDNLGLEAVKGFETLFISDGSKYFSAYKKKSFLTLRQSFRSIEIIQSQVRKIRLRQLIEKYQNAEIKGAYWGISTNINDYNVENFSNDFIDFTHKLANISTRLKKLDLNTQKYLINFGYKICAISMKAYYLK